MLITDDSSGAADGKRTGKEGDQLQAMVGVGNEFMTWHDGESTVQRSGEFARIEKVSGETAPRFLLLHETGQAYTEDGVALTGAEMRTLSPNVKLRKRSKLFVSEHDTEAGDLPFRPINGYTQQSRIARYFNTPYDTARGFQALPEAHYTAQAGKPRIFPMGDGTALLLREVVAAGDPRWFGDSMRGTDEYGHSRERGLRAARVELVELNTATGKTGDVRMGFDVHSGLLGYPGARFFSNDIRSVAEGSAMFDDTRVFAAFAGVLFGSSLTTPAVGNVPVGGDASDTYAVAAPAMAKAEDGRQYLSLLAVYPTSADVRDGNSSGAYRLTCQYTTPDGDIAYGKVNFPPLPTLPEHYLALRGVSLHRSSPNTVMVRINVHVMQYAAGGAVQPVVSDAFFCWTQNNGATWTYAPVTPGFPGVFPYGGLLTRSKDSFLAFSWFKGYSSPAVQVHQITASGTAQIGGIEATTFSDALMPAANQGIVPYQPVGFGGVCYLKRQSGVKKRLWMQFEPYWSYARDNSDGLNPILPLQYPGARPMLMVSDDDGVNWARRFLPTPWQFLAGFVVSIDPKTLAVPVYSQRNPREGSLVPLNTTIYLSKDGGDSWQASGAKLALPAETWLDGRIVMGAHIQKNPGASVPRYRYEQDVSDASAEYNRGELHPLIALRDADGRLLPANPARPWMQHHQFKEPSYG